MRAYYFLHHWFGQTWIDCYLGRSYREALLAVFERHDNDPDLTVSHLRTETIN